MQLGTRLVDRAGRAVGTLGEHRVEGITDRDDPRAERDLLACEAIGVAAAAEALVARPNQRPPTGASAGAAARIRWPMIVWRRMNAHSSSSSGPGLSMIESGIATLPMLMQLGGVAHALAVLIVKAERRATPSASSATPLR